MSDCNNKKNTDFCWCPHHKPKKKKRKINFEIFFSKKNNWQMKDVKILWIKIMFEAFLPLNGLNFYLKKAIIDKLSYRSWRMKKCKARHNHRVVGDIGFYTNNNGSCY